MLEPFSNKINVVGERRRLPLLPPTLTPPAAVAFPAAGRRHAPPACCLPAPQVQQHAADSLFRMCSSWGAPGAMLCCLSATHACSALMLPARCRCCCAVGANGSGKSNFFHGETSCSYSNLLCGCIESSAVLSQSSCLFSHACCRAADAAAWANRNTSSTGLGTCPALPRSHPLRAGRPEQQPVSGGAPPPAAREPEGLAGRVSRWCCIAAAAAATRAACTAVHSRGRGQALPMAHHVCRRAWVTTC